MSLQVDYTVLNTDGATLSLIGEGGQSKMLYKGYPDTLGKTGYFYEGGAKVHIKPANLLVTASYSYVDPKFFSSAAQSKRVNFANTPSTFPIYGNDNYNPIFRTPTIFDLVKDTAFVILNTELRIMRTNNVFLKIFNLTKTETEEVKLSKVNNSFWKSMEIKKEIINVLVTRAVMKNVSYNYTNEAGKNKQLFISSRLMENGDSGKTILLVISVK